jgi:parallel beta-helix repeat protein
VCAIALVVILLGSFVSAGDAFSASFAEYDYDFEYIWIEGDEGLETCEAVVSGTGTESDPYLIEGWSVRGYTAGIHVENTESHLRINDTTILMKFDWGVEALELISCDNVTIENVTLTVDGADTRMMIRECSNCRLQSCAPGQSANGSGLAILISSSKDIAVSQSHINSRHEGIYVHSSSNIHLEDNSIENAYLGVWIDGYSGDIHILDNTIDDCEAGIIAYHSDDIEIRGNRILNCNSFGIVLEDCERVSIEDNYFENNGHLLSDDNANANEWGENANGDGWPLWAAAVCAVEVLLALGMYVAVALRVRRKAAVGGARNG